MIFNRKNAVVLAFLLTALLGSSANASLRAVQINGEVPISAAASISGAGFDTVIIYYHPYRRIDDPGILGHLERWGLMTKKYNLNLYVRIETGPPIDAVCETSKTGYRQAAADDGYGLQHKPAPADEEFWRTAVFPKIDVLAEMSGRIPLKGVFISLDGHLDMSFDILTYSEFLSQKEPGTDPASFDPRKRKPYLKEKGLLDDYEKYHEVLIEKIMSGYFSGLKKSFPAFEIHLGSYRDNPLHRAMITSITGDRSREGLNIFELKSSELTETRPDTGMKWLPELNIRDYLPEELSAIIVSAGLWDSGFVVSGAEALWLELKTLNIKRWPLSDTESYLREISGIEKCDEACKAKMDTITRNAAGRIFENHNGAPDVALIYSSYMGYMYRDVFDAALANTDLKVDKFENTNLKKLAPVINDYDAIFTTPGYNSVKPKKMLEHAGEILDFVKDGGMLFILDATKNTQAEWMGRIDPELALKVEEKPGIQPKWINKEFKMLGYPKWINSFPIGNHHYVETAPGWRHVAEDNEDKPYIVQRAYGDGMIIAMATMLPEANIIENAWEYMLKIKDRFDVDIAPHSPVLHIGNNELSFVATTYGRERELKITADILSQDRKVHTAEKNITLSLEGGARFSIPLRAYYPGLYQVVLTFSDARKNRMDKRYTFSFLAPAPFELKADKSYYTSEDRAVLRIDCNSTSDCESFEASISIPRQGISAEFEALKIEPESDSKYFALPLGDIPCGSYAVEAKITTGAGITFNTGTVIKKLPPARAETKLLNFRGGLLEVNGRPLFPIGVYSIPPEDVAKLNAAGANAQINYGNTVEKEKSVNASLEGSGISFAAYPLYPHKRIFEEDRDLLREEIKAKADNEKLFMWYLADEPELFGQSPELIGSVYDFVKGIDPYRPQAIVMTSPVHFPDYSAASDILMFDKYPTPTGYLSDVGLFARRAVHASYGGKPVFAIPQSFSWAVWGGKNISDDDHRPNFAEMRCSALQSIAAGVKGIIYWAYIASRYDMRKFPRHEKNFLKLMTELSGLHDVLIQPDAGLNISMQPDFMDIGWSAKIHEGRLYIFTYNVAPAARENITFVLPENFRDKKVDVYAENRSIQMSGNKLADSFEMYGTHIYIVPLN